MHSLKDLKAKIAAEVIHDLMHDLERYTSELKALENDIYYTLADVKKHLGYLTASSYETPEEKMNYGGTDE